MESNGRAGASSVSLGKESKCSDFGVVCSEATHSLKQDMILTWLVLCGPGLREDGGPCRDMPCPLKPKLLWGRATGPGR